MKRFYFFFLILLFGSICHGQRFRKKTSKQLTEIESKAIPKEMYNSKFKLLVYITNNGWSIGEKYTGLGWQPSERFWKKYEKKIKKIIEKSFLGSYAFINSSNPEGEYMGKKDNERFVLKIYALSTSCAQNSLEYLRINIYDRKKNKEYAFTEDTRMISSVKSWINFLNPIFYYAAKKTN